MRILLVDDEPDIRRIAEMSLGLEPGWQVTLANSGAQAIELAASHEPDVILMDMMMPGMDGLTTLGKLRENPSLQDVPVIFMTAKVQRNEVERYTTAGAKGVLHKPFDPMTLCQDIQRILDVQ